jgi:enoyl-CoA hydratase/carnithine racemase
MTQSKSTSRISFRVEKSLAFVTLTRADKHNAMDLPLLDGLLNAAERLRREPSVRAAIISGDGPSFCAGIDVKSVLQGSPLSTAAAYAKLWSPFRNDFQKVNLIWRELPLLVVAAIHGSCFGAGMQLALGADVRIAAPDAQLSIMESKWGIVPDMGGSVLLRELIPIDVAKELTLTGRIIDGNQARALGLVTRVADDPSKAARALAAEIEARSPDAIAAGKFLLQEAWLASEDSALAAERRWQRRLVGRANQRISTARNTKQPDLPFESRRVRGPR